MAAITLTSEYCPSRRCSLLVTTMFCGFTNGSEVGGLAAACIKYINKYNIKRYID